jgi:hypothetical protein
MKAHIIFVLPGALFILLEVNVLKGYTVGDYTAIMALVFKYYHSKCIILLYSPKNVHIGIYIATYEIAKATAFDINVSNLLINVLISQANQ